MSESCDEVKIYENIISKMFRYLKEKVPTEVYDEMKGVLLDEYKMSSNISQDKEFVSSVNNVINVVTKNSRNYKKGIIDEKTSHEI
ncbi:MAG: hypothetical protein ACK56F_19155, partial [bacterium]